VSDQPTPGTPGESVPVEEGAGPAGEPPWRRWLLVALGALLSLALIYFVFIRDAEPEYEVDYDALEDIIEEAQPSPSPSPTPTVTVTATPSPSPSAPPSPSPSPSPSAEPSPEPTPEPSPSPEPPDPQEPATEFGPGVFVVGVDLAPGTYRASQAVTWDEAAPCGWAVKHEGVTDPKDLIGNPAVIGGIPTVTLVEGDTVGMRYCPTFVAMDAGELFQNASAAVTAPPGVWLVGEDIRPGTYGTVSDVTTLEVPGKCYFLITENLENNFQTVIAYDVIAPGEQNIVLDVGQQLQSANCGEWTLLSR
jgi:hypothetical protein